MTISLSLSNFTLIAGDHSGNYYTATKYILKMLLKFPPTKKWLRLQLRFPDTLATPTTIMYIQTYPNIFLKKTSHPHQWLPSHRPLQDAAQLRRRLQGAVALAALGDAALAEPQGLVPAVAVRWVLHLDEDQVASSGGVQ